MQAVFDHKQMTVDPHQRQQRAGNRAILKAVGGESGIP